MISDFNDMKNTLGGDAPKNFNEVFDYQPFALCILVNYLKTKTLCDFYLIFNKLSSFFPPTILDQKPFFSFLKLE